MEKNNINYIFALYTNVALLNALQFLSTNDKKIKEENIQEHFILNFNLKSVVDNYIKKYQNQENFSFNKKEFLQSFGKIIRNLRNYYSHNGDAKDLNEKGKHNNSKKFIEENFPSFQEKFSLVFKNKSDGFILQNYKEREFKIFIISLFLDRNDFLKMKESFNFKNIKFNINFWNNVEKLSRKYGFKFKKYSFRIPIEEKLLNFFKTFNEIKNLKKAFINQSIDLLNYKYNKIFKFKNRTSKKGVLIEIIDNRGKTYKINFINLRKILLLCDEKKLLKAFYNSLNKPLGSIKDKKITKIIDFNNSYKSFFNRFNKNDHYSTRHLIKIFTKILWKDQEIRLAPIIFEKLYQWIADEQKFNNKEIIVEIENNEKLSNAIKEIKENISINENDNFKDIIKKFIFKKISNANEMKKYFKHKKIFLKNEFKTFFINEDEIIKKNFNKTIEFIKKNQNEYQENWTKIRKFIIPLICFYHHIFPFDKEKNKNFDSKKLDNESPLILKKADIVEIFNYRIFKNNKKLITIKKFEDERKIEFLDAQIFYSNYNEINTKLFVEFCQLCNINKIDKSNWSELINKINDHKNMELLLMEKIIENIDHIVKNKEKKSNRNAIFHRSISKFLKYSNYKKYLDEILQRKTNFNFKKNSNVKYQKKDKYLDLRDEINKYNDQ